MRTGFERFQKNLQPGGMFRQSKQTQKTDDAENLQEIRVALCGLENEEPKVNSFKLNVSGRLLSTI